MNASSNAAGGAPLSKEEIHDLPMLAYEGEVMLVQTEGEMARALNFLKKETLLGFDTDSSPSFKKGKSYPTSLIQLAGSELVVLIRLNLTPFGGARAGLLADPGIIKAGDFCFLNYCVGNVGGTIEEQINGAFDEMEKRLAMVGLTLEHVVQMDCLFRDVWNIPVMEKIIKERFHGKYPVRNSIEPNFAHAGGEKGLLFQADAMAYCG